MTATDPRTGLAAMPGSVGVKPSLPACAEGRSSAGASCLKRLQEHDPREHADHDRP